MNYKEYFKRFEKDLDYLKAKEELGLIFDIADEVLRLRIEKGWSQAELAERAGTKQANISRLESGLSNPSINFLQKLAKALDTNISLKFERYSPFVDITTDAEDEIQALPYKGFGIQSQVSTHSSSETSSASTRRIYA
jgi:transcriptional regulator with XRE-family HTH domain